MNHNLMKTKRLELGKTQKEVADAIGLRVGSYCDIENGKKGTKPAIAKKIGITLEIEDWRNLYEEVGDGDGEPEAGRPA